MVKKVFTNKDIAMFVCPDCGRESTKDVSTYKDLDLQVRIKCNCPCGHIYSVDLERRKHSRKKLELYGTYNLDDVIQGYITVKNLSFTGMRFKTATLIGFRIGDEVKLEFTLDNRERSIIKKQATVRNVHNMFVGAEFDSIDHYELLAPFLR